MPSPSKHSPCVGIRTCSDYSPFGVELDGRTVSGGYRYGFQNQEKDDEMKGEGNSINYTYRMHDPRLGRFFAVDPLNFKFPSISTYSFCYNNPLRLVEPDGRAPVDLTPNGGSITLPKNAIILNRFDVNNHQGQIDGTSTAFIAEIGSVRQFEYQKIVYSAVFSYSTGVFIGYHSQTKLDEGENWGEPDITYNSGPITTTEYWTFESENSKTAASNLVGTFFVSGVGETPPGFIAAFAIGAASCVLGSSMLHTETWDFGLTNDAPKMETLDATPIVNQQSLKDDFAHKPKRQSNGKSRGDKHDKQYTHGGKNRPTNPNQRKGAEDRKNVGRNNN